MGNDREYYSYQEFIKDLDPTVQQFMDTIFIHYQSLIDYQRRTKEDLRYFDFKISRERAITVCDFFVAAIFISCLSHEKIGLEMSREGVTIEHFYQYLKVTPEVPKAVDHNEIFLRFRHLLGKLRNKAENKSFDPYYLLYCVSLCKMVESNLIDNYTYCLNRKEAWDHPVFIECRQLISDKPNNTGKKPRACQKETSVSPNYENTASFSPRKKKQIPIEVDAVLTDKMYEGDPCIGRESELRQLMKGLVSRRKSVMITGEAGIGKTALAQGISYRIQKGEVPDVLKDLQIVSVSPTTLLSGTKYRGSLEEKAKEVFDFCSENQIAVFIDEIHQVVGGGQAEHDHTDLAEILKPYLGSGELKIIGATTEDEYQASIAGNPAFARRFAKLELKELAEDLMYHVLDQCLRTIEKQEDVTFESEEMRIGAIRAIIGATKPSHRRDKKESHNPDLALEIFDDAISGALIDNRHRIVLADIIEAIGNCHRLYPVARKEALYELERPVEKVKIYQIGFENKTL